LAQVTKELAPKIVKLNEVKIGVLILECNITISTTAVSIVHILAK